MQIFSVGVLSFITAIVLPVLYLVFRQLRRFEAWVGRNEGPKERWEVIAVMLSIVGFAFGSFAQPIWNKTEPCRQAEKPFLQCLFFKP